MNWSTRFPSAVEDRDHGHGQERRVRAVAGGRLAVAAAPVADERQQQRRDAERPERRRVEQQAGPEAGRRADDRARQERDERDRDEDDVGAAAADLQRREDRELRQERHEDDAACLEQVAGHGSVGSGPVRRAMTTWSSPSRSANGLRWTSLKGSVSLWLTAVDLADGDPARIEGDAGDAARGDHDVAVVHDVLLRHAVDQQARRRGRGRAGCPSCPSGGSTTATALERSLISVTSDELGPTFEMWPSSRPPVR